MTIKEYIKINKSSFQALGTKLNHSPTILCSVANGNMTGTLEMWQKLESLGIKPEYDFQLKKVDKLKKYEELVELSKDYPTIKEYAKSNNMPISHLAEKVGISQQSFNDYARNKRQPTYETALKIIKYGLKVEKIKRDPKPIIPYKEDANDVEMLVIRMKIQRVGIVAIRKEIDNYFKSLSKEFKLKPILDNKDLTRYQYEYRGI